MTLKPILLRLFVCMIAMKSLLSADIIETHNFKEIVQYITPVSLVILDVDDTLLLPVQTLGSDVWFVHRWNTHKSSGKSDRTSLDMALAEWEGVRHLTDVKIVEEGTDLIIKGLQEKDIPIMGLTTQGLALSTRTVEQLAYLNIDLSITAPSVEEFYFNNGHGVLYREGLLSTSGTRKGVALVKLIDLIGYNPGHIIFINDKLSHLKDVEEALIERGIPFTGLRYSIGDDRVANFDPEIADIQWKQSSFDKILSDEEAKEILLNVR